MSVIMSRRLKGFKQKVVQSPALFRVSKHSLTHPSVQCLIRSAFDECAMTLDFLMEATFVPQNIALKKNL